MVDTVVRARVSSASKEAAMANAKALGLDLSTVIRMLVNRLAVEGQLPDGFLQPNSETLQATGQPLPPKYKERRLIGNYIGYLECHGAPDLLLIYQRTDTELIVYRVGSHADLFN
ncbi:type II toxin-antitoxin system mRNA interferase toxin, RelE/StbE family [Xenorhabdus anantnagensis]|uniref:Type II toxin-antitoxin system mRNA interferase toxin, RelE/StbE family n=1 Tax=Xenorhabdus anantnagensis TaxID=3025875 RepID=A0ABT5LRE9_9GAMM|nr:type II toxin-antitoxin system mRNA interferase toxin, RelE/StbE family [Xenorhabdus anantnagensis]MDC9596890.1 type II toxin-antitoxin system mRNA interferase toxin, RelE/StbE family [Xenorhabdus anantnagensis]